MQGTEIGEQMLEGYRHLIRGEGGETETEIKREWLTEAVFGNVVKTQTRYVHLRVD